MTIACSRVPHRHLDQASRFAGSVPGHVRLQHQERMDHADSANWTRIVNPTTVAVLQFTFRSMPFKNIPSGGDTTSRADHDLTPKPPFAGPPPS